jgi:hypothetical protein
LSDVATATHARHAHHLARCGDRLLPWFRAVFADLARTHRVTIADLVHEHPGSPNVLARPQYTEVCVDPWGTEAEAVPWVEPRLVEGPAPGTTLLALGSARIAAHVFTATAVPASDVIVARLMATSFDSRLSAAGRDRQRGEQPEVPTSTRAVYQPERWRLSESELGGLLRTRSARRFVRWRQLAKHYRWPSLVRLVIGDAPAILVATESPLAVEAAFEGIRAPVEGRSGALVVEAVVERGWLQGPRGFHLTEIVVPVRRAHHLWSANKSDEAIAHG